MAELKPGWQRVKFGEMANYINDRVDNPAEAGVERYVGLEHLDPESLTIRRWGSPDDVESTKLRFKPGDIIFGKRRAYQRKLAVASFEGICSAHAMVLRAKPAVVLPDFLPFFMQSDLFMERAVEISVGSLSPTINWKALAQQEFTLPPLAEQVKMLKAFSSAHKLVERARNVQDKGEQVVHASLATMVATGASNTSKGLITEATFPADWYLCEIKDICSERITSGTTPRTGKSQTNTNHPFLRVQNLSFDGSLCFEESPEWIESPEFLATESRHAIPGDILINIVGPPLGKVSLVPAEFPESLFNQAIVRYRISDPQLRSFVLGYLQSAWAKDWLFANSTKTSGQRNINVKTASSLPIPVPPSDQLAKVTDCIEGLFTLNTELRSRHIRAGTLYFGLLSKLLRYRDE